MKSSDVNIEQIVFTTFFGVRHTQHTQTILFYFSCLSIQQKYSIKKKLWSTQNTCQSLYLDKNQKMLISAQVILLNTLFDDIGCSQSEALHNHWCKQPAWQIGRV